MHTDDRYRRAAAAGGVGIWDWDLATGEIYVDPILKEMLGYQDHEKSAITWTTGAGWYIPMTLPPFSSGRRLTSQVRLRSMRSSIGCFIATGASDGSSHVAP